MNGMVSLSGDQVRKLKSMNKSATFDSTFVSYALSTIFGDVVLKVSSAGGRPSNYNSIRHNKLDENKLNFIRGKKPNYT